ncbi:CBS domain-containing protein [Portibacter lacus]|uniref:Acetoin utilization protein n=1 Tax=Portibacter lacus TaxID=1099794 RepID=A0AA37WFB9_9BACT|nr:CBS domain-containing protein [Portibacter lacus]GLR19781.1 acetoin utilization protein [Portibacter lacus]
MIANELISQTVSSLRTSDLGEEAITIMNIFHVKHLPIVNNEQLLGVISEEEILGHELSEPIGSYTLSMHKPYAKAEDHMFEVMSIMAEYNLTVVPVVDQKGDYIGLITQDDLIQFYAKSFSFTESGSILVLKTRKRDYSLAEISRIIEMENASILSSFITNSPNSDEILVTLKLNVQDIQHIIATLERYEYTIKSTFAETEYIDSMKERFDSLMHFLNV